jgi:crotonobetainyl-CoA:carnitine CoA-transferase CaiB-like acyl-CoA transferase
MASLGPDGDPLPRPHLDRMQLGLSPRYRLYEAADGWLCVAAVRDAEWSALLDALGLADDADADAVARAVHERTARDAFALLDGRGVPCEIADPEFSLGVFDDPELRARGLVVTQDHPVLGRFDHFGTTIDFSETPGQIWGPPPLVGQHTREIMHEYGFDDDDVDKLIEIGAVFEERRMG